MVPNVNNPIKEVHAEKLRLERRGERMKHVGSGSGPMGIKKGCGMWQTKKDEEYGTP